MDEKQKRQRPMVNAATVEKCKNLKFLGYFLNATGAKREDLTAHMGITTAAFGRWFSVDDIRYSNLVRIYDYFGYDVKMVFTYADDKAPSRATAYAILNMLDPSKKLNPLFVEMKLNNYNFETIGAKLSHRPGRQPLVLGRRDCSFDALQVCKCDGRDSGASAGGER